MPHWGRRDTSQVTKPMPHLTATTTFNTDTSNIQTICETGKTSQRHSEMRRYNNEVLGISKTHWTQDGQER